MRIITAIITVITTTAGTPKTMAITTIAGTLRMVYDDRPGIDVHF